jgi:hypothetical protein
VAVRSDEHGPIGTEPEPLAEHAVAAVDVGPDDVRLERKRTLGCHD